MHVCYSSNYAHKLLFVKVYQTDLQSHEKTVLWGRMIKNSSWMLCSSNPQLQKMFAWVCCCQKGFNQLLKHCYTVTHSGVFNKDMKDCDCLGFISLDILCLLIFVTLVLTISHFMTNLCIKPIWKIYFYF